MEDNYRSTPEILRLAGAFISGTGIVTPKPSAPTKARRAAGCALRTQPPGRRRYRYLLALAGRRRAPFAVLYRNNDSALPLIDALERAGLPYRCRSFDDTFFTHRIVSDVRDILRFAAAPDDAERFLRIYYKFGALISREAAQAACVRKRAHARAHSGLSACADARRLSVRGPRSASGA
ncbi:MAG: 3'-5' exonuclease [Acutalibacteraceae bacterium]